MWVELNTVVCTSSTLERLRSSGGWPLQLPQQCELSWGRAFRRRNSALARLQIWSGFFREESSMRRRLLFRRRHLFGMLEKRSRVFTRLYQKTGRFRLRRREFKMIKGPENKKNPEKSLPTLFWFDALKPHLKMRRRELFSVGSICHPRTDICQQEHEQRNIFRYFTLHY